MECSPRGSSVHGILQARILGWIAILFFRGSSRLRDQTHISDIAGSFFTIWAIREAQANVWSFIRLLLEWILPTPPPALSQGFCLFWTHIFWEHQELVEFWCYGEGSGKRGEILGWAQWRFSKAASVSRSEECPLCYFSGVINEEGPCVGAVVGPHGPTVVSLPKPSTTTL